MKKHVLHLITGLEVGGAETMLLRTLPLLQRYFENDVCCIKGRGSIGRLLEERGIPVFYLDLSLLSAPLLPFRFFCVVRKTNPDLLITYLIHADIFGRIFGKMFGIRKIICNQRGFYLNWKFLRILDRATTHLVTRYFVQTRHAKEVLMQTLNLPEKKFRIIPNAIDIRDFKFSIHGDQKKKELGIPDKNINIVCVSNLKPRKGYEELFEAFEQIYQSIQNVSLLVVGDGDQKGKYMDQIADYSSRNNIFFLGRRDDVKDILSISDIFVLGTYSEGMSNAILEAMAAKLAIVTTDIEVNRDLIRNDESGLLVAPKNASALSEKIIDLICNEGKRRRLGDSAYQTILKTFEMQQVIQLIRSNYEDILYES